MGRLDNKVAIVTGGARGLGKVFCMALAEEGTRIVVADILEDEARRTATEIKEKGGSSLSIKVDISSEEETTRMAE
jgi:NAD(P)-dependent dehydrogenase (short-subunit alcohol dehydrogenase family)